MEIETFMKFVEKAATSTAQKSMKLLKVIAKKYADHLREIAPVLAAQKLHPCSRKFSSPILT
jgi:hypothetical protein